jgi:predicted ATP-grasp superfamily ATP-dependent carboligase
VRCLGRAGIAVTVAEPKLLAPARWSRYATRRVDCPDPHHAEEFLAWLLRFGEREPGHVLYPTSDDMAWLFALHRERLQLHFRMYQPPVEVLYTLLNKRRLHALCEESGLDMPATWFPRSEADLARVAAEAQFPALIKPQTQVLFESHMKGSQVESAAQLPARYAEFHAKNRYGETLLQYDPEAGQPMVQAFYAEAAQNIYSLSGFVDRTGELFAVRAAVKVLQRPRKLGIGLCFESAPVDAELAARLQQLCKRLGYYGTFEVEFIRAGGKQLLIDFNPRYYSQMGFDIARGLPLPLLVYTAACGEEAQLPEQVRAAASAPVDGAPVYLHRGILELLLRAQGLSGRLTPTEVAYWRSWYARHRAWAVDAVLDAKDPLPGVVDAAMLLRRYARHPRGFVRTMVLDQ